MERTRYSDWIDGNKGNYHWPAWFDRTTAGYLGISQKTPTEDNPERLDQVLLSPTQIKALLDFLKPKRRKR